MFVDETFLSGLGVGHDAACHGAGYLSAEDVGTLGRGNHDVGVLVLLACLGQPCLVEVAVAVVYKLHLAVYGEPVGMHVEEAHED